MDSSRAYFHGLFSYNNMPSLVLLFNYLRHALFFFFFSFVHVSMISFTITFPVVFFFHSNFISVHVCMWFCVYISTEPQTEVVDEPTLSIKPSQQVHTESLCSSYKQERTEKSSKILIHTPAKHRYAFYDHIFISFSSPHCVCLVIYQRSVFLLAHNSSLGSCWKLFMTHSHPEQQ